MGDLTKNLSRWEFMCPCDACSLKTPAADFELVTVLQNCADHFAAKYNRRVRIDIFSANRCEAHNKAVGGALRSKHKDMIAADFAIRDVPAEEVVEYLESVSNGRWGIGQISERAVHLDVRPNRSRWTY